MYRITLLLMFAAFGCSRKDSGGGYSVSPTTGNITAKGTATIGDLRAEIIQAGYDHPLRYKYGTGEYLAPDDKLRLVVAVKVANASDRKLVRFSGWHFGSNTPSARDDLGNEYKGIVYQKGLKIYTDKFGVAFEEDTVEPGKDSTFAVVLEKPSERAKSIVISLPAEAFGLSGKFSLKLDKIPVAPR